MSVQPAEHADIAALGRIAEGAGLFPAEYLPEMIEPALAGGPDVWLVAERDGAPAGLAFARPEELTDRVWNILALRVAPDAQGQGLATSLLHAVETQVGARMIVIETTQLPEQAAERTFYAGLGYGEEGRVRDFYAGGEDKIIFCKVMP